MGNKIKNFIIWYRYTPKLQDVGSSNTLIVFFKARDMRYQQLYNSTKVHEGGTVTFRDDSKGNTIGISNIKIGSSPLIENVVLVDGLKQIS